MSSAPKCIATTKQNQPCKNNAKLNNLCHLHQNNQNNPIEVKTTYIPQHRCIAEAKSKTQCWNYTSNKNKFCHAHQTNEKKEEAELYNDVENIVAEYLEPEDYEKLIKYDPKFYSWDKYYKLKTLPTIHEAIAMDNTSLVNYLYNKSYSYHIGYTDENLNVKSTDMLKLLNKINYNGLSEYNYEGIITHALNEGNYFIIDYIIRYKKYNLSNYNFYRVNKKILLSGDLEKVKYYIKLIQKAFPDEKQFKVNLQKLFDSYYILALTNKEKIKPLEDYINELMKEYNIK